MIAIQGRSIGAGLPCYVIAEIGVNHNGNLTLARELIRRAADAGADAVKFQTYRTEELVSTRARKADYQLHTTGQGSQYQMLKELELSAAAHRQVGSWCQEEGVTFLSTPFDLPSVDLLEELRVPAYKVGSGDLTNLPLLRRIGRTGKPMIISTGMNTLGEVEEAVEAIHNEGNCQIVILHCTSSYPTPYDQVNLRAMETLRVFGHPVGYSDHTEGTLLAGMAVALGACVIEKHFTLDRNLPGPDHRSSLTPEQFRELVQAVRAAERAMGNGRKAISSVAVDVKAVAEKSLVAAAAIEPGTIITADMVKIKRPGTGMAPKFFNLLIGRTARRRIEADEPITWESV